MDDNKVLCLSNSERIKIPSTISILFEVQDVAFATPATISRCGIVYFEQVHIGILSIIRTWGSTSLTDLADSQQAKLILSTIEANLQVAITYVRNECIEKFPSTNNHLSIIFLNLFTAQLRSYQDTKSLVHDNDIINALVVWCIIWSVGANIHDDSRVKFIEWCRVRFSTTIPSKYSLILSDPYGVYIDLTNRDIKPWVTLMKSDNLVTNNKNESNIYINTIETTKYIYLFDNLLLNNHNILLCGDMCIGKSMLIKSYLSSVDKSKGYSYVYNYSINTNPVDLSNIFEKQLEKKRKNLLAPFGNNSIFYLFIDDINISDLNSTNVQPVNELLRNIIDVGGYYDQNKLFYKNVNDTVIIGACSTTGGRNNSLNPRLLSKFHMIWMSPLSNQSLNTIYTSKLNSYIYNNLPNLIQLSNHLVTSSIEMLSQLKSTFLPSPKQSHYVFTLNNLSNVFDNITSTNSSFVHDEIGFMRLWIHEHTRIFRDRLINESDRMQYDNILLNQVNQLSTDSGVSNPWNKDNISSIVYNCYIYNDKSYRYIQSSINQSDTLLDLLNEYHTQSNDRLDIVFFPQAINHINRLTRIIAKPYNHALLLGSYGTGRKSLTRLSAYLCNHRLYTISLSTTYSIIDWKENIKELISSTCISNTPTVFMVTDNDIIDELFLEDINAIVCNNQIINIFTDNELETILNELRLVYRQTIKPDNKIDSKVDIKASKNDNKTEVKLESRETILNYFSQQLEKLLKIVICLTPDNSKYRARCQRYPTIFTHCTIDFYDEWSDESMTAIAYNNLSIANLSYNLNIESYINTIVNISILLYKVVKLETLNYNKQTTSHIHLTTNHFLEYLNTYINLYYKQSSELFKIITKYTNGLNIITSTDKLIKSLDKSMKELKPKLETNIIDSNELMNQLKKQEIIIQEQKVVLNKSIDELTNLSNDCIKMKQECQNELDVIIPTYDNAIKALNTLDKKSIQELKGFSNPPDLVKYTLETICILFNKPTDWNESKILLNQIDFIEKCKNYDKNNINSKIIRKLDKYINDSKFIPEEVKKQSVAAMCLCMWVKALYTYSVTLKSIEPKQINISNIEKNIEIINNEKLDNEMKLNDKVNYLNQLNDQINNIQTNQVNNEKLINDINKKLKVSNDLINLLNYEKTNWLHNVNQYNNQYNILYVSMCISSSFLTYLSNFNSLYRNNIINQFYNVMKSNSIDISNFNLIESLVNKQTINQWEINQLPSDNYSLENGIYITSNVLSRYPIIIDPNNLAQSFIKHAYKQLYTIKCINNNLPNDYVNTLENCIKNGYVCVIEDYYITNHQIDKYINIIIKQRSNNRSNNNILTIRWNDRDLNYSNDFKLFIINKYNNMNYSIDIYNDFYIINYCPNSDSLEQQLLVEIISHEKPELQDKLNQLMISLSNDQKELTTVENDILNMLSNSTAEEIVSSDELIVVLGRSKNLHVSLSKRIEEAETTSKEIRDTKEGYRMLAKRGAILFNVISSLSSINPMYTYSHQYLITLFNSKLTSKSDNKNIALRQRINSLLSEITKAFYLTISYSLLEKDRLLYAFLLSIYINVSNNNITLKEWDIYINGINFDNKILEKRPYPNSFHKSKYLMTSNNASGANTPNTGSPIASPTSRNNVKSDFNTGNKTNRTTFSNVSSAVTSPKAVNSTEDKISNVVSPLNVLKSPSNNSALQSPKGTNTTNVVPRDTPTVYINTIITKKIWQTIVMLESTLPVFDGLCADIMSKTTAWIDFLVYHNNYDELDKEKDNAINKAIDLKLIDKDIDKQSEKKKDKQMDKEQEKESKIVNSTNYNIPNIWETKLSEYQKLLLIRLISKERQINSINKYICNHLGNYYNDNNLINLSDIYSTTSSFIPIMYAMTAGNNPIDKVIQLARSKDIKIDIISLGQGQETVAEKALVTAINQGSWLCFENCHLAPNYMITLNSFIDKHIINHKNEKIHKDFRLWLITLPTTSIPLNLITNSIKLMNDTTNNLKSNVIRSLNDNKLYINVNNINSNNENFKQYTLIYKKIIYSTVLLHNIINERCKYQSIGFNNNYNWLNNDCKYSISLMNRFINDNYISISSIDQTSSIPWQLIQHSTNTLVYNGRVTDSWDERVINSYVKKFFNDDIMSDSYNYVVNGFTSLPSNIELDNIIEYAKQLPNNESCEILGLHPNISINYMNNQSDDLILLLHKFSNNHSTNPNNSYNNVKLNDYIVKLSDRIPKPIDNKKATTKKSNDNNNYNYFLLQEISRYNQLIDVMSTSIHQLIQSLNGYTVLSTDSERLYNDISNNHLPNLWISKSYLSNKSFTNWIEDFIHRIDYMTTCYIDGFKSNSHWISCYFYPNSLIYIIKQIYSREIKSTIDLISISCEITSYESKDVKEIKQTNTSNSYIYIYGLYIEGCRFNRMTNCIEELFPRQFNDTMPVLLLKPITTESKQTNTDIKPIIINESSELISSYLCPIYRTNKRSGILSLVGHSTNYIDSFYLPSHVDEDHWIQRGVAMVTMLED